MVLFLLPALVIGFINLAATGAESIHLRAARNNAGNEDVYYVARMLDKLKVFAETSREAEERLLEAGQSRVSNALAGVSPHTKDAALLRAASQSIEETRREAEAATTELLEAYHTVAAMMGSHIAAPSCQHLACGPLAECVSEAGNARCQCKPCFDGDGFVCRPGRCPRDTHALARPLGGLRPVAPGGDPRVSDVQVAVVGKDHLVLALRDETKANCGFLVAGHVTSADVTWGIWRRFSDRGAAFGTSVAGFHNGRFLVAYRDRKARGIGYLVGGTLAEGTHVPDVQLQTPTAFIRPLSLDTVLVPLASSRAVCVFGSGAVGQTAGGAAVVQVLDGGSLDIRGKYHFAHGLAVEQLAATALSATSFAVAFRALPPEDAALGTVSKELSVLWMELINDELVIDPHVLELEPQRGDMGSRALALVSEDTFAYSYMSDSEHAVKMAMIHVDKKSHRMTVTSKPQIISKGDSAYVKAASLPSGSRTPTTFTYLQHPTSNGMAEVCAISVAGQIDSCKDLMWADTPFKAVSGTRLMDGRLVFVFSDMKGAPFYRLLAEDEV